MIFFTFFLAFFLLIFHSIEKMHVDWINFTFLHGLFLPLHVYCSLYMDYFCLAWAFFELHIVWTYKRPHRLWLSITAQMMILALNLTVTVDSRQVIKPALVAAESMCRQLFLFLSFTDGIFAWNFEEQSRMTACFSFFCLFAYCMTIWHCMEEVGLLFCFLSDCFLQDYRMEHFRRMSCSFAFAVFFCMNNLDGIFCMEFNRSIEDDGMLFCVFSFFWTVLLHECSMDCDFGLHGMDTSYFFLFSFIFILSSECVRVRACVRAYLRALCVCVCVCLNILSTDGSV